MKALGEYGEPRKIEFDPEKYLGTHYIVPVKFGVIKGWNYSIRDVYKIVAICNAKDRIMARDLIPDYRERTYSKPTYYKKGIGYVDCKCEECIEGQRENPDMDKKPEILKFNKEKQR